MANDPDHVVIDFKQSRVYDHSGIDAIQNVTDRYKKVDKKLHLLNLDKECELLLQQADNIVEISVIDSPDWHLADRSLSVTLGVLCHN